VKRITVAGKFTMNTRIKAAVLQRPSPSAINKRRRQHYSDGGQGQVLSTIDRSVTVWLCGGHDRELLCKNGWTDRDAVWISRLVWARSAMYWMKVHTAPPGEYDWTIRAQWRYGLSLQLLQKLYHLDM